MRCKINIFLYWYRLPGKDLLVFIRTRVMCLKYSDHESSPQNDFTISTQNKWHNYIQENEKYSNIFPTFFIGISRKNIFSRFFVQIKPVLRWVIFFLIFEVHFFSYIFLSHLSCHFHSKIEFPISISKFFCLNFGSGPYDCD